MGIRSVVFASLINSPFEAVTEMRYATSLFKPEMVHEREVVVQPGVAGTVVTE
jgi:hypothetical protein